LAKRYFSDARMAQAAANHFRIDEWRAARGESPSTHYLSMNPEGISVPSPGNGRLKDERVSVPSPGKRTLKLRGK
jgi:hypothetical protein